MRWHPLSERPDFEGPVAQRDGHVTLYAYDARPAPNAEFVLRPFMVQITGEIAQREIDQESLMLRFTGRMPTGQEVDCILVYDDAMMTQMVSFEPEPEVPVALSPQTIPTVPLAS